MKKSKALFAAVCIVAVALIIGGCSAGMKQLFSGGSGKIIKDNVSSAIFGGDDSSETQATTTEATTTKPLPRYTKNDKLIAMTFDDGPRSETTGRILDLLEQYDGAATFFVIGENVKGREAVMQRAIDMCCQIGNHSMNHKTLPKLSESDMFAQINDASDAIERAVGVRPVLMRAPGGSYKGITDKVDMPLIQWNIDTEDWKYRDQSNRGRSEAQRNADIQKIVDEVLAEVEAGDIILMHDIYDFSADVCEVLIPALAEKGYKFVTVSEMYEIYGEELTAGNVYRGVKVQ